MIQRIQTVYLAIAGILLMLLLLLDVNLAYTTGELGEYFLTPVNIGLIGQSGTTSVGSSFAIAALLSFGLFLTIFAIMKFKARKLQIKLVQGAMLVQLIAVAPIFYYADKMSNMASTDAVSYSPVLAVLLANVVLYFLAIRGIKKDDALVRSADRLR